MAIISGWGCGPANYEPSEFAPTPDLPDLPEMLLGTWLVDGGGNGTFILLVGNATALGNFDTVSIRDMKVDLGEGPAAVVACGEAAWRQSLFL